MYKFFGIILIFLFSLIIQADETVIGLLSEAIDVKDAKKIEVILKSNFNKNKFNINEKSQHLKGSLFHKVIRSEDMNLIKLFVKYGADVNAQDYQKNTSLHIAVEINRLDIAEFLIKNGAHVNDKNRKKESYSHTINETPLHISVKNKDAQMAQLLIQHGANVNAKDREGKTAFYMAVENNDPEIIKLFLNTEIDFSLETSSKKNFLHPAIKNGNLELIKLFIEKGVRIDKMALSERLVEAVKSLNMEEIEFLVKNGARSINKYGLTLLAEAYYAEAELETKLTVMQFLIDNGAADVNEPRKTINEPPLLMAIAGSQNLKTLETRLKVMQFLIDNGADVNIKSIENTPLHDAYHAAVIALLLKNGADPNIQGSLKRTPLHWAAEHGEIREIEFYLKHASVDLSIKDIQGKTVKDILKEKHFLKFIRLEMYLKTRQMRTKLFSKRNVPKVKK